jgi:hypothetical protein
MPERQNTPSKRRGQPFLADIARSSGKIVKIRAIPDWTAEWVGRGRSRSTYGRRDARFGRIPGWGDTTVPIAAAALRYTLSELCAHDWKAETVSIGVCAAG